MLSRTSKTVLPRIIIGCWISGSLGLAGAWDTLIDSTDASQVLLPAHREEIRGARNGEALVIGGAASPVMLVSASAIGREGLGEIAFEVEVPKDDTYHLWVRLQWHCDCSRAIELLTSAETFEIDERFRGSYSAVLTSRQAPRVWHWVHAGSGQFGDGEQTVSLLQRGHMAAVDTIALTNDSKFTPPGYLDRALPFRMEEPAQEWLRDEDGHYYQWIGDQEWSSFQVSGTLRIPDTEKGEESCAVGVGLSSGVDGLGYELLLTRSQDGPVSACLCRVEESGGVTVLGEHRVAGRERWHGIRITRTTDSLEAAIDGLAFCAIREPGGGSARLKLISEEKAAFDCRDLEIRSVPDFTELFMASSSPWEALSGQWRIASPETGEANGGLFIGSGQAGGVALAPWKLGPRWTFSVHVRPVQGYAGVALDVEDQDNFWALQLGSPPDGSAGGQSLVVFRRAGDVSEKIWSCPVDGRVGQWHELIVLRSPQALGFSVDGQPPHFFRYTGWDDAGTVGLIVSPGSTGTFASVRAHYAWTRPEDLYVFNPETDSLALSHWQQKAGMFVFMEHPALLHAFPADDGSPVRLELRRPVPTDVEVVVVLQGGDRSVSSGSLTTFESADSGLDLPFPVTEVTALMPDAPRVAIALLIESEPPVEYLAAINWPGMQHLTISRNGTEIAHATRRGAAELLESQLYFRMKSDLLQAGLKGGLEVKCRDPWLAAQDVPRRAALCAQNLNSAQGLKIIEIAVTELLPTLGLREAGSQGMQAP